MGKIGVYLALWGVVAGLGAEPVLHLKITGVEGPPNYFRELMGQALKAQGYQVEFELAGNLTGTRMEAELLAGDLSAVMLGETADRSAKFLPIRVGMLNNLIGKRILFIPKGTQKEYDGVKTLEDFRRLGKVAGMGIGWAEMGIWKANNLPAVGVDGDWKVLYKMVEAKDRGVDYLPRGANEMVLEPAQYPNLEVEKHLLLVYDKDQVLYVSPKYPELKPILEKALTAASRSGLIKKLVSQFYRQVFEPPLDIDQRTVIALPLPDQRGGDNRGGPGR